MKGFKASDMRVGNVAFGNRPFKLTAQNIYLALGSEMLTKETRWLKVPLDPEWLERSRFVKRRSEPHVQYELLVDYSLKLIVQLEDNGWIAAYEEQQYESDEVFNTVWVNIGSGHSVDELQNLFFFSRGEELKMKDDE